MSYAKANFTKGGLRAGFFTNLLRRRCRPAADARPQRRADHLRLRYDDGRLRCVERADVCQSATWSATAATCASTATTCRSRLTPTTAPSSASTARTRSSCPTTSALVAGGRVDRFDFVDDFVFSPRVALLIKPDTNQTFRVSYNQAYRSPSVINNFIDLDHLAAGEPRRPRRAEHLPASGQRRRQPPTSRCSRSTPSRSATPGVVANGRAILSAAYYMNWLKNDILFTQPADGVYTAANPPSNWPLPPVVIAAARAAEHLPAVALHVSEFRQEHEPGHRARRQRVRQPVTPASLPTTRIRPIPTRRTFPSPS